MTLQAENTAQLQDAAHASSSSLLAALRPRGAGLPAPEPRQLFLALHCGEAQSHGGALLRLLG